MKCSDCKQEIQSGQAQVIITPDFIVHQTCLDEVEAEWEQTKSALRAMHFNPDDCGWRERHGITTNSADGIAQDSGDTNINLDPRSN